jgi:hypothetical protein
MMRAQRVIQFVALYGVAVGLGAVVATSCINVDYPTVAFRCNPRQSDNCPETHFCCSDDPAAVGGGVPAYMGKGIDGGCGVGDGEGCPIFSGQNNAIGTSGMCVRTSDIPAPSGLLDPGAANCPIPCNPTWTPEDINAVCGTTRVCCQTVQLEAPDCIQDGDTWRPVTGADILAMRTDWARGRHPTAQDPGGEGCRTFTGQTNIENENLQDCYSLLTVADQRGFCMALQGGACPTDPDPPVNFVDVCKQITMGLVPPPL